ncbi:MAG: ribose-phosphate pyrophosphokinase, partial [Spirochaetaceae bacterium]|nr:ribose-phosphate pyrophosphokinase [Spirochaetaceae bacterium]
MSAILVTATRGMHSYAQAVVGFLKSFDVDVEDAVGALSVEQFADGEMEVVLHASVRGKIVILFANCARNRAEVG